MVALEPDPFLNELGKLFEKSKAKGSLSITMKRSMHKTLLSSMYVEHRRHTRQYAFGAAANMKPRNARNPDMASPLITTVLMWYMLQTHK